MMRGELSTTTPNATLGAYAVPWQGQVLLTGAWLLARINLSWINVTCTKFSKNLEVAQQVTAVLLSTGLEGTTDNINKRYGYNLLKLENENALTISYLSALLLCSGRGQELYQKYNRFRKTSSEVWKLLKVAGIRHSRQPDLYIDTASPETLDDSKPVAFSDSETVGPGNTEINSDIGKTPTLLEHLEQARPTHFREPRSPILVGLGLGFLGQYFLGKYFGNDNADEIANLNNNIQRTNKNIRLTNERVDILARNVSDALDSIKGILDKIVDSHAKRDIHYAINWNLEQLISSTHNIRSTFKWGDLTATLLNRGILNAELINLNSLRKIIDEGRKSFPDLDFPLAVERYQLIHIINIIKIQRIAHHKYVMILPLVSKQKYKAFSLVPLPVQLGQNSLVLPELKNTILTNNNTYVLTDQFNVYTINMMNHLLLTVEPIHSHHRPSCEWAGLQNNNTAMLTLCHYKKIGHSSDHIIYETEQHRLAYFTNLTEVTLTCPTKTIKTLMIGLHKIPLTCDAATKLTFWPAKHTMTVNLIYNDSSNLDVDSTPLPIISIDDKSKLHNSLKELLAQLPKKSDSLTIDFDSYELSLETVQSYSILAQSMLTLLVILNTVFICFLLFRQRKSLSEGSLRNKFDRVNFRDSIRSSLNKFRQRKLPSAPKFPNFRDSLRSSFNRHKPVESFSKPEVNLPDRVSDFSAKPSELNWQLPQPEQPIYAPWPRYI